MKQHHLYRQVVIITLLLSTLGASGHLAYGESLFRAGISYKTAGSFIPRSLLTIPKPRSIGDMVTINIVQSAKINVSDTTMIMKTRQLTENSTNIISSVFKKLTGFKDLLPSVNGVNNQDDNTLMAQSSKTYSYTDNIACQVVQVLPNGTLIVQGKKTVFANKEEQDLYVSGIINPFFLDETNTVTSDKVGNLQMHIADRGTIARQHGDGILGKYFQFFN